MTVISSGHRQINKSKEKMELLSDLLPLRWLGNEGWGWGLRGKRKCGLIIRNSRQASALVFLYLFLMQLMYSD